MCEAVMYLKSHGRRPVWRGYLPQQDRQGAIPAGWCHGCGKEVFSPGESLCERCMEQERQMVAGKELEYV